jgi:hypothetical protein
MSKSVHLLFAAEDADSDSAEAVASLVRSLKQQREWTYGEIAVVDDLDEASATQPDDAPIPTLGGILKLTRPTGHHVDERSQYEDVEFLVDRLCEFSDSGHALVVEYEGEELGEIRDGRADASLREGLLGVWSERLHEP